MPATMNLDFELVRDILQLLAPAIDVVVVATPTPFDNLAWAVIKRLILSPKTAVAVYDQLAASGHALPPLSAEIRATAAASAA